VVARPKSRWLAGLLPCLLASPLAAQIDYRSLDSGRPVLSQDAYPVERYAFEFLAPYRFEDDAGGSQVHVLLPELAYGAIRNGEVGLELPLAAVNASAGTDWGLAGLRLSALYNFNTESGGIPAISIRGDASFAVGSLAGDGTRGSLKAIATQSWGSLRLHLNASRGFGPEDALGAAEALPRWQASAALDRTFFRSSLLLIAEVATTQTVDDRPSGTTASLGGRWQWTPTLVLDLGATRRLSDFGPDLALTLGLSYTFGIRALLPAGLR